MSDRLIIGYDAKRIVRNRTGLGSYGRTLVNDIARCAEDKTRCAESKNRCAESPDSALQLRLYAPDEGRDDLRNQIVNRQNITFCYPSHSVLPFHKAAWRTKGIVQDLRRDGVQIFHGLSGELPIGIRKSGIKSIVTIHDLIFLRHPEFYKWMDTKIYAWKFRQTIHEADHIIAVSECTKRDIIELGQVDARRISVIYQSFSPRFSTNVAPSAIAKVRHQYGLTEPFILSVGSIEERKNIGLAIHALSHLPEHIHLVAIGKQTDYSRKMQKEIWDSGLGMRIHLLHGIDDAQLNVLYHAAEAFVYPSRYEGFGIPIVEAISCGLPVVACTGSCLEEAGGPDSLYVAPDDAEGMANAIRQSLRGAEGREQRILRSREYIRRFEGCDVASQIIDLYHSLL